MKDSESRLQESKDLVEKLQSEYTFIQEFLERVIEQTVKNNLKGSASLQNWYKFDILITSLLGIRVIYF